MKKNQARKIFPEEKSTFDLENHKLLYNFGPFISELYNGT